MFVTQKLIYNQKEKKMNMKTKNERLTTTINIIEKELVNVIPCKDEILTYPIIDFVYDDNNEYQPPKIIDRCIHCEPNKHSNNYSL